MGIKYINNAVSKENLLDGRINGVPYCHQGYVPLRCVCVLGGKRDVVTRTEITPTLVEHLFYWSNHAKLL